MPDLETRADEPFVHRALLYRGLEEYLTGTLPFIVEGLAAGEPVAVAVPGARLEPLRVELGAAAARVRLVDMGGTGRNPGRIIPGVLLAFAEGTQPRRGYTARRSTRPSAWSALSSGSARKTPSPGCGPTPSPSSGCSKMSP